MFDKLIEHILGAGPLGVALAIALIFLSATAVVVRILYKDLVKAHNEKASMAKDVTTSVNAATAAIQSLEKIVLLKHTGKT